MKALPRRGTLGLVLGPRRESQPGAPVLRVHPDGAGARAGVLPGDVITAFNTRPIDSPAELSALRLSAQTQAGVTLTRDGHSLSLSICPEARALERHPGARVIYGEVSSAGLPLRSVLCVPEGRLRPPCVFYIPGYPCVSVEDTHSGVMSSFVRALVSRGIAVFRVDKRGTGDSEGDPASAAELSEEYLDLAAALASLTEESLIDTSQITLFGHSLGGLHAPRLASQRPTVRGVALYGAGVLSWREYLIALMRRRMTLQGRDPAEQDDLVREAQSFHGRLFAEGLPLATLLAAHPEFWGQDGVGSDGLIYGRRESYWQAVNAINVPRSLRAMSSEVLVLWGEADWLSFREEHVMMAEMVNQWRPGSARFAQIDGADHAMCACDSMRMSFEGGGARALHPGVVNTLARWIHGTVEP